MADAQRKRIWGWYFFDWATQPFYTLGLTFVFGPYFAAVSLAYFLELDPDQDAARAASQSLWFWGQTLSGLFIAFTAPLIGAYADSTGRRMPWIWAFSLVYVLFSWAIWYLYPDASTLILVLISFNLALIAAEFLLIFVNAILPSLGNQDEIGRISGTGAALGYWGGVLSLFLMLLLLAENESGKTLAGMDPLFGLDADAREGTRSVGPFIALWFVVFMIPFFAWVREKPVPNRQGGIGQAIGDLKQSLRGAYRRKSLFNFLLSSMFYRDALNALYSAGGVYATLVLGWSIIQIGVFGIVGAVTAAIVTQVGGMFDSRFGPRPVIRACVWVLIAVSLIIVGMSRESLFGLIAFAPGSGVPDIVFYLCGASIGGAGGALYSASRSMMVRHTHPERPTEAFGLFALSGKATSFLAPFSIGLVTALSGSAQLGYIPVILLFLVGLLLLRWVHPEGDRKQWSATEIPAP
ncbi:MAG: MFS transporter [Rhodobacteraceae bacterium]|nr:MFS transporter [Paracoccaceae bacterium]